MPSRVSSPRLIGRAAELERLDELFTAADENAQPGVYVLGGEAGVGKSRLVAEFVERVEARGGTSLVGGCLELVDRALPYAPIVEALRQLVRRLDATELDAVLGPARRELAHLLPELDPDGRANFVDEQSQQRLFEHVLGVLDRLAERSTTVLVLEDLHWADRSTLDLLAFLARNLSDTHVVVLANYRSDELHRRHPLRPWLAELDRSGRVERHELQRFTRDELTELVAAIRGVGADDALVDDILSRSDGNAFFAEELIAAGGECAALPPTLRDLLLARIDALSDNARDVLRVAAVIGTRVPHVFLEAVRDSGAPDADRDAVRECVEHQVLLADESGYRFRHALVQEAVYDDLLPGERSDMHVRVASVLAARPELLDTQISDVDAELACHWYAAHDLPNALKAAVRAADSARQMFAYPEALAHLERALELWDRVPEAATLADATHVDILRRAADVANLAGRQDLSVALARRALDEIDEQADPITAALVHERLARFAWTNSQPFADVIVHNEAAVALVPAEPPTRERAIVEAALGQQLMVHDRNEEALVWCDAAIATAQAVGDRVTEGHARNSRGAVLAHMGHLEEGLAELYLSLEIAREAGAWSDVSRAHVNISGVLEGASRYEEALAVAEAGLAEVAEHGLARCDGVFLRTHVADALFELGRWDEVEEQLREIDRMGAVGIDALHRDNGWFGLHVHRGDIEAAQAVHERAMSYAASIGAVNRAPWQAGALAVARGDLATASEILEKWMATPWDVDAHSDYDKPDWLIVELLAATVDAGPAGPDLVARAEALVEALEQSLASRAHLDVVRPYQQVLRALAYAELERAKGNHDPATWAAVAEMWRRIDKWPHVAYARWREGEAALRAGLGVDAAREPLAEAFRLADEIGAKPIRNAVADLATRARVDLGVDFDRPDDRAASAGLTAREIEVIELVARGRTNRQIADELFISVKTASVHVSNILMKLDAQNRGEAAARARELGLVA